MLLRPALRARRHVFQLRRQNAEFQHAPEISLGFSRTDRTAIESFINVFCSFGSSSLMVLNNVLAASQPSQQ